MELLPIWKASIFEGLGSLILIWLIGIASPVFTLNSPVGVGAGLAFLYGSAVALIMLALKPISGAHINPLITLSHLTVESVSVFRGSAYILAQMVGAMVGGGLVAAALGSDAVLLSNGGCVVDSGNTGIFKPQQAFALEFMAALVLLILAHSTGYRSGQPHGTSLTPFLYGLTVGLINFCTSGFAPHAGYIGSFGFPNVCFGLSMGIMKFQPTHWVFWIPGFVAVVLHGLIYRFLKPYDTQEGFENEQRAENTSAAVQFPPAGFGDDNKGPTMGIQNYPNHSVV